jgi:hypothetical protein
MASITATTVFQLVVLLTWACLDNRPPKKKHPIFSKVLPTQAVVEELLSAVSVVFAPGLFEVLQASTPPTLHYFKGLPTDDKKRWGIYLLVLEKPGARPKIYIGSGTQAVFRCSLPLGRLQQRYQYPLVRREGIERRLLYHPQGSSVLGTHS